VCSVAPEYSKVGWNASDTRGLSFTDCRVPAANLLGEHGRGYAQFLRILDEGRIAIAALGVGLAQGCIDECVRYSRERSAFGHAIGHYQAIQFPIADMEVRAHTARLAYYPRGEQDAPRRAVQEGGGDRELGVLGGYGFMNELPVGRFYRDAKILEIGEGTSEVQRMVIARDLGVGD
jgi:alkylation response protein AidB-like acyl-CoA dehydrogenase